MHRSLLTPVPELIDQALRILAGNGLPPALIADVLDIACEDVEAMAAGASVRLWPAEIGKLELFCAILIRLEIRLSHDPRAVREMLATPQTLLDGRTPGQAMADGIDGLRAVHSAIGEMALPAQRWWRVAPCR